MQRPEVVSIALFKCQPWVLSESQIVAGLLETELLINLQVDLGATEIAVVAGCSEGPDRVASTADQLQEVLPLGISCFGLQDDPEAKLFRPLDGETKPVRGSMSLGWF